MIRTSSPHSDTLSKTQWRRRVPRISSGINELDYALQGGAAAGQIIEWGMPNAYYGRQLLLTFLSHADAVHQSCNLWISPQQEEEVYPPAWEARNVNLETTYFVNADRPVDELRPVFLNSVFRFLVLDTPRQLNRFDMAFVAQKARQNQQWVFLVRNYFLTSDWGNPWANIRVNCRFNDWTQNFSLDFIRGCPQRKISFAL